MLICQKCSTNAAFFCRFSENFLTALQITAGKKFLFQGTFRYGCGIKFAQQILKIQACAKLICLSGIKISHLCLVVGKFQRAFRINGSQRFTELRHIVVLTQGLLCLIRFDFLQMGICIFNTAKLHNHFRCRFLSHTRNARNIVRGISHQSFQFNDLRRRYLIFFQNLRSMIIFDSGFPFHRLWQTDHNLLCRELEQITVAGKNCHIHSLCLAPPGNCAQKVVCLVSFHGYDIHAHGTEHFLHKRNLLTQFLRHCFSGAFVCVIDFMAECRCMKVKSNGQIIRFFLLQHFKKDVQKSVNSTCMPSFGICQVGQSIKCSV